MRDTLDSVIAQEYPKEDFEILIVDNDIDPSNELAALSDLLVLPPIRYIHEPENGLHNTRHAGARAANGEILVFIDDDVIVPKEWLMAILKPYKSSSVACVGGRILPQYEENPPEWLVQFSSYLSLLDHGSAIKELHWPEDIYGCNFSIRKSVLFAVGGFNPDGFSNKRLIWYRGDGEIGLLRKVYKAGFKVIYTPCAWLYHRVPVCRQTPKYIYRRFLLQGISDSYTFVRHTNPNHAKVFFNFIRHSAAVIKTYLLSFSSDNSIFYRARSYYWYARARHILKVAKCYELRQHILKSSYL